MVESEREIYYILSDIHLGNNDRVNWYQKNFQEAYLSEVLSYMTHQKGVKDLIINGDWFDDWVNKAQSKVGDSRYMVHQIISAHPDLFTESMNRGNFISLNKAISGNLCFVHGNHDMKINAQDINEELNLEKPIVDCGDYYANKEIYAEHGHLYTVLNSTYTNKRNTYSPLPLGYYITRISADLCSKQLKGEQTAADLEDNGVSIGKLLRNHKWLLARVIINKFLKFQPAAYVLICFLIAILSADADIYDVQGVKAFIRKQEDSYFNRILKNYKFYMPDDKYINAKEAIGFFKKLCIPLFSDRLHCDANGLLNKYALKLSKKYKNKHKIIALGHTHFATSLYLKAKKSLYVNSGFMCPDRPNFKKSKYRMTFVEIEKERIESRYQYTVRIKNIDQNKLVTTIREQKIPGRY